MTEFGDPDFSHHKALGLMWVHIALSLLTSPVFPGKADNFGFIVEEIFENLHEKYGGVLEQNGVTLGRFCCGIKYIIRAVIRLNFLLTYGGMWVMGPDVCIVCGSHK